MSRKHTETNLPVAVSALLEATQWGAVFEVAATEIDRAKQINGSN